jgi:hypothetical protein
MLVMLIDGEPSMPLLLDTDSARRTIWISSNNKLKIIRNVRGI